MRTNIRWQHPEPKKKIAHVIKYCGPPTAVAPQAGGIMVWNSAAQTIRGRDYKKQKIFGRTNCFTRCELRDEQVLHYCPAKHYDYFYSYIAVDIPPSKLMKVLSLSGSVGYDPLRKELYARCASIHANVATLCVATDIIIGRISIARVQREGLYRKIIRRATLNEGIAAHLVNRNPDAGVTQLYARLCNNLREINKGGKAKHTGFWCAAFSDKMCSPGIYGKV